jgi:hypothetical protein
VTPALVARRLGDQNKRRSDTHRLFDVIAHAANGY